MGAETQRKLGRKMHQTTVRFGTDLWEALAEEAERVGVSVAQYVRDAALMRLSYEEGRRAGPEAEGGPLEGGSNAARAQERAIDEVSDSTALLAMSELARRRAMEIRSRTNQIRARNKRIKA
jgi:hypothetical protein